MKIILTFAACLFLSLQGIKAQDDLEGLLKNLDSQLDMRDVYANSKLNRIAILKQLRLKYNNEPNQIYNVNNSLIDEYYTYNFDSTFFFINENLSIGHKLNDYQKTAEAHLRMALLHASSGNHFESNNILKNDIDTLKLSPALLQNFYFIKHKLAWELLEYSKDPEIIKNANKDLSYYRNKLKENELPNSALCLDLDQEECLKSGNYAKADSICAILVTKVNAQSHDYAKYAYQYSLAKNGLKDNYNRMIWLAKSAITDCQLSIKDYASLATLSALLFDNNDIDRAFKYINISMADALFYNARLRPWQVASVLPLIEQNYREKKEMQNRQLKSYMIITISLIIVLLCCSVLVIIHARKLAKAREQLQILNQKAIEYNKDLEHINTRLSKLNKDIAESNTVKEEYIGLFLNILSENINKLQDYENGIKKKLKNNKIDELRIELSKSNLIETEIENFYRTFDTAFLSLYPSFVEDFNALLLPDEHIETKKGEMMTTEMRIFALIRLGITDSSKIASLLRYSVNTIYNYRAKIKNKAKISREDFEDQIKSIGSFKS